VDAESLVDLLGRSLREPGFEQVFAALRTRQRPALDPTDRDEMYDWLLVRRQGVELGFVDEVYFTAGPKWKRRRDPNALVLCQIYFYTQREDISTFGGRLPYGLEWRDNRSQVRRKLAALESRARHYRKDVWDTPEFRMVVDYKKAGQTIDSILCERHIQPWPEEGRRQPVLDMAGWVSLFGMPASSPELKQKLRPLDVLKRIDEEDEDHEIDFIFDCGLEMYFTEAKNLKLKSRPVPTKRKDLVFGAARFLRSRDLDGRQWAGDLPFALRFDDTQETLFTKVGRKPDAQEDEDFSGFALWHFPEASLHVMYSNVENHLMRVMIMAPGFA
jgi:hypothetical protein